MSLHASAAEPVKLHGVVLLQPEFILKDRVASATALSVYIQSAQAAAAAAVRAQGTPAPNSGFIVIAVRPGLESKVWLDFDKPLPAPLRTDLLNRVGAVKPFAAQVGPVVFGIHVGLSGGAASARQQPQPAEWSAAASTLSEPIEIGDLVERIWPKYAEKEYDKEREEAQKELNKERKERYKDH